jgi:hypothetical protein
LHDCSSFEQINETASKGAISQIPAPAAGTRARGRKQFRLTTVSVRRGAYAVVLTLFPRCAGSLALAGAGTLAISAAALDAAMSNDFFRTVVPISWPCRVSLKAVDSLAIELTSMTLFLVCSSAVIND